MKKTEGFYWVVEQVTTSRT